MKEEKAVVSWRWIKEHCHLLNLIAELEEDGIDVAGSLAKKLREVRRG